MRRQEREATRMALWGGAGPLTAGPLTAGPLTLTAGPLTLTADSDR